MQPPFLQANKTKCAIVEKQSTIVAKQFHEKKNVFKSISMLMMKTITCIMTFNDFYCGCDTVVVFVFYHSMLIFWRLSPS